MNEKDLLEKNADVMCSSDKNNVSGACSSYDFENGKCSTQSDKICDACASDYENVDLNNM